MRWRASEVALLVTSALVGLVVPAEVVHGLVDGAPGDIDDACHAVMWVVWVATPPWVMLVVYRLVSAARWTLAPGWVFAAAAVQLLAALALPVRDVGASAYFPGFPPTASGPAMAVVTVLGARPMLHRAHARLVVTVVAGTWLVGSLLVGLIDATEGGGRGMGPLWRAPLVGNLVTPLGLCWLVLGVPLSAAWGVAWDNWTIERSLSFFVWSLALALFGASAERGERPAAWGVVASGLVLFPYAVGWSSFVAD